MSGEHSGNFPDLPPLEYFPTPERELPTDLKDRAAWLEMEMAKVRREMANLQVSAAATDRRRRDSVGTPSYPFDQEGAATPIIR
ncbi:hypothetical protein CSKR_201393 [Clonorchis sinensis]|uniref:Uncharacterized protein n=1 Tax=Clonorchis sinensis TaxID=79923 RepID=A0A8T1MR12_CLOSI|nr:hypothetical protein CSKR_201393 [Clonorchis sinensis]